MGKVKKPNFIAVKFFWMPKVVSYHKGVENWRLCTMPKVVSEFFKFLTWTLTMKTKQQFSLVLKGPGKW